MTVSSNGGWLCLREQVSNTAQQWTVIWNVSFFISSSMTFALFFCHVWINPHIEMSQLTHEIKDTMLNTAHKVKRV